MDDAVTVGVANRVCDLAGQIEPDIERQGWSPLSEEMVESDLVGVPAEKDGRAEFMFVKIESAENTRVVEAFQNLKFL